MSAHYRAADVHKVLADLPLARGDVVFLHSNLGFFGRPEGVHDAAGLCQLFFDALMERVGPEGTLLAPTFTYSYPRKQAFDPAHSASEMGMFAEWLRKHPDAHRSNDPCYSVAAIGGQAVALTQQAPENSFGPNSVFERFLARDGLILNLNFDAGSTFLHYLERQSQVPYRFDKTFEGLTLEDGVSRQSHSTIYVRYASSPATEAVFEPFHQLALAEGLFSEASLGRGRLGCIRARACEQLIRTHLPQRPWMLTRAEALGLEPELLPEPNYQPL